MNSEQRVIITKYGGVAGLHQLTGIPKSTLHDRAAGKIKNPSAIERLCWELLLIAPEGIIKAAAKRVAEKRKRGEL